MVAALARIPALESNVPAGVFTGILARLPELRRAAKKASRVPDEAEDLLQDALLELVRSGRQDLGSSDNMAWLHGVLRNLGAMHARTAVRRRARDDLWGTEQPVSELPPWWADDDRELGMVLAALPAALRRVAQLALSGHDRHEIAWLLGLRSDTLRQRIASLRQRLRVLDRDLVAFAVDANRPSSNSGVDPLPWTLDLLRRALLPVARFSQGVGVADPDGHLMVLSGSMNRKFPAIPPHVHAPGGNNRTAPSNSRRAAIQRERPSAFPSPTRILP